MNATSRIWKEFLNVDLTRYFYKYGMTLALASAILISSGPSAWSAVSFFEPFDVDATSVQMPVVYPDWLFESSSSAVSGVEVLGSILYVNGSDDSPDRLTLQAVSPSVFVLTVLAGQAVGGVCTNVSVDIGPNRIVFHPGFAGTALRVEGPGGHNNIDLGFTIATAILHLIRVDADGTGNFELTLTDALNPVNTHTESFFNPTAIGGTIALARASCPGHPGAGMFDQFRIGEESNESEVDIDIKPGSDPNCFNANGHGVIPVSILGSSTFDVTLVDTSSLSFGGLEVRVRGNKGPLCNFEDSDGDTILDLVCHFEDDSTNWTPGDGQATITGMLLDSTEFEGTDSICVVP